MQTAEEIYNSIAEQEVSNKIKISIFKMINKARKEAIEECAERCLKGHPVLSLIDELK